MKKCICNKCPRRFYCFTNKKVFSNPLLQAIFESYLGENCSVEYSIQEVRAFVQDQFADRSHELVDTFEINAANALRVLKGRRR